MAAVGFATQNIPPPELSHHLPYPKMPWRMSPELFRRIQQSPQQPGLHFKACQVHPNDPEWEFVLQAFNFQRPEQWRIRRIVSIHNGGQAEKFEQNLVTLKANVGNTGLQRAWPTWNVVDELREQVIQRWENLVRPYSEISLEGRSTDLGHVRVLPVWHATAEDHLEGIINGAFVIPGIDGSGNIRTDPGFYGLGTYFGTGARYVARLYLNGGESLLLTWVSMTEPLPVVPGDRQYLEGQGNYGFYDAHFIPISERDGLPPQNGVPDCDELVVFQNDQTLPRFLVQMQPNPVFPIQLPETKEELLDFVISALQHDTLAGDDQMKTALKNKATQLFLNNQIDLLNEDQIFFQTLHYFLSGQGIDPHEMARQRIIDMGAQAPLIAPPRQRSRWHLGWNLLLLLGGAAVGVLAYRFFNPPATDIEPTPPPPPPPPPPSTITDPVVTNKPVPADFIRELFTTRNVALGVFSLVGAAGMVFILHKSGWRLLPSTTKPGPGLTSSVITMTVKDGKWSQTQFAGRDLTTINYQKEHS